MKEELEKSKIKSLRMFNRLSRNTGLGLFISENSYMKKYHLSIHDPTRRNYDYYVHNKLKNVCLSIIQQKWTKLHYDDKNTIENLLINDNDGSQTIIASYILYSKIKHLL